MTTGQDQAEQLAKQALHYVKRGFAPDVAAQLARNDLRIWDNRPGLFGDEHDEIRQALREAGNA